MSNLVERYTPWDPVYGDDLNHIIDVIDGVRYNLVNIATAASGARYVVDTTSIRAYDSSATNYGAPSGAGVTFEVLPNGSVFIGGGSLTLQNASVGKRWIIDATSIRGYDGTTNNYGAPSGAGVDFEAGNTSGTLFLGGTFTIQSASSGARLVEDATSFRLYDGTATNYGAPSGVGVTFEAKNDGTVFASKLKLQSSPTGSYILLNAQGAATPGVSPYEAINDGTRDRVQLGNLAAYTDSNGVASPSGYGMRALDSSGNILFDTSGIAQVMTLLGSSASIAGGTIAGVATPAGISGGGGEVAVTTKTFTLSRKTTVKIEGEMAGIVTTTAGIPVIQEWFYIRVTGQTNTNQVGGVDSAGHFSNAITGQVITLAAGTYTANLFWNSTNGTNDSLAWSSYALNIFQMGG